MKTHITAVVLRSLLGLLFVAAPLASAFHVFAEPSLPPSGTAFVQALAATGYMLPLIWAVEMTAGVLLLVEWLVPFALLLLAPVIVNIAAFHIFLAPSGLGIAALVAALECVLAWQHREAFRPLFMALSDREEANASRELRRDALTSGVRRG